MHLHFHQSCYMITVWVSSSYCYIAVLSSVLSRWLQRMALFAFYFAFYLCIITPTHTYTFYEYTRTHPTCGIIIQSTNIMCISFRYLIHSFSIFTSVALLKIFRFLFAKTKSKLLWYILGNFNLDFIFLVFCALWSLLRLSKNSRPPLIKHQITLTIDESIRPSAVAVALSLSLALPLS